MRHDRATAILACLALLTLGLPARAANPATIARFDKEIAASKTAMVASLNDALVHATAADTIARAIPDEAEREAARATAGWLRGEALTRLNRVDEAAPVIDAALASVERHHPETKIHGDLLKSRANVFGARAQIPPALRDLQRAHAIYRKIDEPRSQAMALQDIGSIYSDAGDYEKVLYYYAQSAEVFGGDPALMLSTHNNRAEALKKLGRLAEAEREYRAAFGVAVRLKSPLLEARILTNLASAQRLRKNLDAADATADRGLALATGEAAGWRPFLWGVKASIALERSDLGTAAALLTRTFRQTDLATTTLPYREFHQTAYKTFGKLGDFPLALAHLEAFKRLDDEARALTASSSAALLSAQFDFTNQNLRIARLKAGQIAADATIAKAAARLQAILFAGALAIAGIVVTFLLVGFFSLRRSRDEVRAANATLSTTNDALGKALQAKTEFLATTSHEIRTPLNGILGMTEVILADDKLGTILRERLQVVHGAGVTMRALVDDILDVAKMENGHLTLSRSDVALPRLLEDVGRLWQGHADAKDVDLVVDLSAAPARIVEDEARLRQIVFNLMSNAIKFTDKGRVSLVARTIAGERPLLVIEVSDTGLGIPADKHDEIFESFKQVDGGTTRRFGGTGLGLAICRNLARAMGGTIALESTIGQGSTFRVELPLVEIAHVDATDDAIPRAARFADCSLLVVERNPLTRSILTAVLGTEVRQLEFADSANAAAATLETGRFDQVLVELASLGDDATMLHALRALIANAAPAEVTVLATVLDPDRFAGVAQSGATRVLIKPIAPGEIVAALREIQDSTTSVAADVGKERQAA